MSEKGTLKVAFQNLGPIPIKINGLIRNDGTGFWGKLA